MVPSLLFDLSSVDLSQTRFSAQEIEQINPHRGDMRLLDGIIHISDDRQQAVAFKQVRDDEFWVPGHIPGRPLLPGVLMIEAAAQLASYVILTQTQASSFLGFVGADKVKFRGQVVPGDRLIILGKLIEHRPRRFICDTQGLVNGNLVYQGQITGMPI